MIDLRARLRIQGLIDHTIVREGWNRAAPRMGQVIASQYRLNLSGRFVRIRTGDLSKSVTSTTLQAGAGLARVEVGSSDFKAAIFEGGAEGHEIRSPRGRLLRFRSGNQWIQTRRVQHPGLAPRRPLATAIDETAPIVNRILEEEFAAAAARRGARG